METQTGHQIILYENFQITYLGNKEELVNIVKVNTEDGFVISIVDETRTDTALTPTTLALPQSRYRGRELSVTSHPHHHHHHHPLDPGVAAPRVPPGGTSCWSTRSPNGSSVLLGSQDFPHLETSEAGWRMDLSFLGK